jgi:selenocysteine lyase/cysteine desulfurase
MERKLFPFKPNMQELDCDFVFSGHKICGPTGRDFIWKESWLNKPAYQGGGEMIKDVSLRKLLMLDCP